MDNTHAKSFEITDRLRKELEKNPEAKLEDVKCLQEWIATQNLPLLKDFELFEFYYSCLYDIKMTKKCIEMYFKIRRSTPELFTKRDVSIQPLKDYILNVVQCFPLGSTKEGNQLIVYRVINEDASVHSFTLDIQLLSLAAEVLLHKIGSFPGLTILADFDKAGIKHMLWAKWGHLRVVMKYLQEAFPVRLESIQIVSSATFMNYGLIAIRPITSGKVLNKMVFHKLTDLKTLHEKIPKENLPEDYGGLLPSCDKLNSDYLEEVSAMKSYFDEKDAFESLESTK